MIGYCPAPISISARVVHLYLCVSMTTPSACIFVDLTCQIWDTEVSHSACALLPNVSMVQPANMPGSICRHTAAPTALPHQMAPNCNSRLVLPCEPQFVSNRICSTQSAIRPQAKNQATHDETSDQLHDGWGAGHKPTAPRAHSTACHCVTILCELLHRCIRAVPCGRLACRKA